MEPQWSALAAIVKPRRLALRLTQRQAAVKAEVSDETWLNVERGKRVSERTLTGVDLAMDWEPGSAAAVLKGGEPNEIGTSAPSWSDSMEQVRAELDSLRDQIGVQEAKIAVLEREKRDREAAERDLEERRRRGAS